MASLPSCLLISTLQMSFPGSGLTEAQKQWDTQGLRTVNVGKRERVRNDGVGYERAPGNRTRSMTRIPASIDHLCQHFSLLRNVSIGERFESGH